MDFITDFLLFKNKQKQIYNLVLVFINKFLKYI